MAQHVPPTQAWSWRTSTRLSSSADHFQKTARGEKFFHASPTQGQSQWYELMVGHHHEYTTRVIAMQGEPTPDSRHQYLI